MYSNFKVILEPLLAYLLFDFLLVAFVSCTQVAGGVAGSVMVFL